MFELNEVFRVTQHLVAGPAVAVIPEILHKHLIFPYHGLKCNRTIYYCYNKTSNHSCLFNLMLKVKFVITEVSKNQTDLKGFHLELG